MQSSEWRKYIDIECRPIGFIYMETYTYVIAQPNWQVFLWFGICICHDKSSSENTLENPPYLLVWPMAQREAVFPTVFHHVSWNFLCHVVWGFPSWYPCGPIFKTNWACQFKLPSQLTVWGFPCHTCGYKTGSETPTCCMNHSLGSPPFRNKRPSKWTGPITWSASLRDEGCRSLPASSPPPRPHGHTYHLPVTGPWSKMQDRGLLWVYYEYNLYLLWVWSRAWPDQAWRL